MSRAATMPETMGETMRERRAPAPIDASPESIVRAMLASDRRASVSLAGLRLDASGERPSGVGRWVRALANDERKARQAAPWLGYGWTFVFGLAAGIGWALIVGSL